MDFYNVPDGERPEILCAVCNSNQRILIIEQFQWCVEHTECPSTRLQYVTISPCCAKVIVRKNYFVRVAIEGNMDNVYFHGSGFRFQVSG
tara:strand:+ start:1019 stop:1288 length:270 start_codon:yes stop_codon:yes gene_type:complete